MDGLYFGNDLHTAVVGLEDLADLLDVLRCTGEGSRDKIVAHAAAELDVGAVLLADERHRQVSAGKVHALVVGDRAAVDDRADHLGVRLGIDAQANETVIDEDHPANCYVGRQILVSDRCPCVVAQHLFRGERKSLPLLKFDLSAVKIAQADLRSLGVEQRRDRQAELTAQANYSAELGFVLLVGSVREIESRHVHACFNELLEHLLALACRSNRADNFGLAHFRYLTYFYVAIF